LRLQSLKEADGRPSRIAGGSGVRSAACLHESPIEWITDAMQVAIMGVRGGVAKRPAGGVATPPLRLSAVRYDELIATPDSITHYSLLLKQKIPHSSLMSLIIYNLIKKKP